MTRTRAVVIIGLLVLFAASLVCAYSADAHERELTGCEWTREAVVKEVLRYSKGEITLHEINDIVDDYFDYRDTAPCPNATPTPTPTATPSPTPTPTATPSPTPTPTATPTPMPMSGWSAPPPTPSARQACPDWEGANQVHRNDDGTYQCSQAD